MKKTVLSVVSLMASALMAVNVSAASVSDMMNNAFKPVGKCLYVYGGGWNEADTGAGDEAMTYGLSKQWEKFYNENGPDYDYDTTRYQIHDGLDCTGYMGWLMYQLYGDKYSSDGYVFSSAKMVDRYAEIFGGTATGKENVTEHKCGDIMGSDTLYHVYMVIGQCEDGSVVLLNSTPPNVALYGTSTPDGKTDSEAVKLAEYYMSTYFPDVYKKYPNVSKPVTYLTEFNKFSFDPEVLTDSDGYRDMGADEILKDFFENIKLYVDGNRVKTEVEPYIDGGSTYIQLSALAGSVGADVKWNEADRCAEIEKNSEKITVDIDSKTILKNGEVYEADFQIKEDRINIPLRQVSELLGLNVDWEGISKSVYITQTED